MWTVISNISTLRKQSTVILTTHSMEEAEALCPKMGIMVDGKFQCFGSAQHIKDKYADGFDIDLKIKDLTEAQIVKYISQLENEDVNPDTFVNELESKDVLERLEMGEVWDQNVSAENRMSKILR
jgi:ATP-binding cassette subfamily A (ABC1) protein 3